MLDKKVIAQDYYQNQLKMENVLKEFEQFKEGLYDKLFNEENDSQIRIFANQVSYNLDLIKNALRMLQSLRTTFLEE